MIEIRIFSLKMGMKNPFKIAHGTYDYRENVFIQINRNGRIGYGEAPIVPYYGISAEDVKKDLQNCVNLQTIESLELMLNGQSGGKNPSCRYPVSLSALQSALASIGQQSSISRDQLLLQTSMTLAYDDNIDNMIEGAQDSGFHCFKVKAGIPGDVERIRGIKNELPDSIIRVDANQGWTFQEAQVKIAELEDIGVELIEEPIAGAAEELETLARNTRIPIILDESVQNDSQLNNFLIHAPHIAGIVVKIAKTGGPCETLALIHKARNAGLKVMLSCMVESSVGVSAALPLAPLCDWIDLDGPLLLADDPFSGIIYDNERPLLQEQGITPSIKVEKLLSSIAVIRLED
ncbi:MAG: hypothetical protein B6241_03720 [Spirochaetaceae bacterium 4572_59]|nr:MAG: hypothetical protein B6241_03720 [Spirochaetaceae bacterium 4572_59]